MRTGGTEEAAMGGLDIREQDLVINKEQRTPCLLALDVSSSMAGAPIEELNSGLEAFEQDIKQDELAALRCEVAIVAFGGSATLVQDFVSVSEFTAPKLAATGDTPLGGAILLALDTLRARKDAYKRTDVNYTRPWLIVISDGAPTDDGVWQPAVERLRQEESAKGVVVYPVGVQGADMGTMARLSAFNAPQVLQGLKFREFFRWLSVSQKTVSTARPGGSVQVPSQQAWAQAPT
jgi:uncharacterized protein YegL